ncbi:MAG: hypothetical protein JST04_02505 [Bdellovibrionales bacterium]|nr:hypothetical protein [Bdellovibrionales bacterium]
MPQSLVLPSLVLLAVFGSSARADEPVPMCERVSINLRADGGQADPARLKGVRAFVLEQLAKRGYHAKYVAFYAPGEDLPASRENEILKEAGEAARVAVEVDYADDFLTQNLGLRIYKIDPKSPYNGYRYVNANETIGPVRITPPNLRAKFRKLLKSGEMLDCAALAAKTTPASP